MLKEVDKTTSDEPEGESWMARTIFPPQKFYSSGRRSVYAGRFSHAGISSTADVQGRALCPGSTPGAPLNQKNNKPELKVVKWRMKRT